MIEEFVIEGSGVYALDQILAYAEAHTRLSTGQRGGATPRLIRRTIDARGRRPKVLASVEWRQAGPHQAALSAPPLSYPEVSGGKEVIVVGAGPAGLFCALKLIELGLRPIVIERGRNVRDRRRQIAAINREGLVDPDSNYAFGEGGAGTYSDGKLYTRSGKRGSIRRILEVLVGHGANPIILADAHPHIGTNKLPDVISRMTESIRGAGGEVLFQERVTGFVLEGGRCRGVRLSGGIAREAEGVVLATGHSARDIFEILVEQDLALEAKPFALGVRVEHEQSLIDGIQYGLPDRGQLPPASYSLTYQHSLPGGGSRGVFSFCMCPGGFIVPAATEAGQVVVNGMSPSRRDSRYANSGIVTQVGPEDWAAFEKHGPLAGLAFQRDLESRAFQYAGAQRQTAPAQRVDDFIRDKLSVSLEPMSYQPGLQSTRFSEVLPRPIYQALAGGFRHFGKQLQGYSSGHGQVIGLESRTSSPVRIPRDPTTLAHPHMPGLYPCGEGAGYAGGIVSAAMDGERVAEAVAVAYGVAVTD